MTRLEIERAFRERAQQRQLDAWHAYETAPAGGYGAYCKGFGAWCAWRRELRRHNHVIGVTPAVDEEVRIAVDRCLVRQ